MEIKSGKLTLEAAAAIICGAFFLVGAQQAGFIETLGYEQRSKTYQRMIGSSDGFGLGLKTYYLREGQVAFVDYTADVRTGGLRIGLIKSPGISRSDPHFTHKVGHSASGQVTFSVPASGLYRFYFDGTVLGGDPTTSGYDLSYQVRWGVRPGPAKSDPAHPERIPGEPTHTEARRPER